MQLGDDGIDFSDITSLPMDIVDTTGQVLTSAINAAGTVAKSGAAAASNIGVAYSNATAAYNAALLKGTTPLSDQSSLYYQLELAQAQQASSQQNQLLPLLLIGAVIMIAMEPRKES